MKHFRHAYTLLAALLLCGSLCAQQQRHPQRWGGGVDDEWLHFGFGFHYVNADYKIALKPGWQQPYLNDGGMPIIDSLYGVSSPFTNGVGLGLLADLKLGENADLRFTPTLVFSNKTVNYRYTPQANSEQQTISRQVKASFVDLPLLFKFKSDRKGNYRGYLIGGGKYSVNVN